jgi:hypothetical protein
MKKSVKFRSSCEVLDEFKERGPEILHRVDFKAISSEKIGCQPSGHRTCSQGNVIGPKAVLAKEMVSFYPE